MGSRALSWDALRELAARASSSQRSATLHALSSAATADAMLCDGPTNAQSRLRLFGASEDKVRVVLYRDNHAWCPYCQKVWLWLEEKRVPYRIEKVTMFCYGEKEAWYKRKVPSGMLPALELDGRMITESDVILEHLETAFGPLAKPMRAKDIVPVRKLERTLFSAWCRWLCYPARSAAEEAENRDDFLDVMAVVERTLAATPGPFFLETFSTADVIFTPYVERMNASLFYYKGYLLRDPKANPNMARWFAAMESRETYLGTQSDFHTHCHDLPPQMGGCYENGHPQQQACKAAVDEGPWSELPDTAAPEPADAREEALARTIRHRQNIIAANPGRSKEAVDEALRCALTHMMTGESIAPPRGSDVSLRYIKDRINVPRDMSVWAARRMRAALEHTAALAGPAPGPAIPIQHRRDQDPRAFAVAVR